MAGFRAFQFDDDSGAYKSTDFSIVIPAGAQVGDAAFCLIQCQDNGGAAPTLDVTPSGWTEILAMTARVQEYCHTIWGKILAAGEPGSTINWSPSNDEYLSNHLFVCTVSGSPGSINDVVDAYGTQGNASSTTFAVPDLTNSGSSRIAIAIAGQWSSSGGKTGWTGSTEVNDGSYYSAYYEAGLSANFTGDITSPSAKTSGTMAVLVKDATAAARRTSRGIHATQAVKRAGVY